MDGHSLEHSDSDSGESWTLLESNPAFGDEAPGFAETPFESPVADSQEKDDDTDGISIISDSDHETHSPYQIHFEKYPKEIRPIEAEIPQNTPVNPHLLNFNTDESLGADNEFLGDNNKHRIYVHKRNKRLSTVLNIIVLGSVITAAGVAIGHMWGAKNDCSMPVPPSVNKILSNLYKLQEENAYLRDKLKELSQYHQIQQKLPNKINKCRKVFEESLNNKNVNRFTKCVDVVDDNKLESHFAEPSFERNFVADINKLENIYKNNKSWLDREITKRLKVEKNMWNNNINILTKSNTKYKQNKPFIEKNKDESSKSNKNSLIEDDSLVTTLKKVSYADSLKSDGSDKKMNKRDAAFENNTSKLQNNKKMKDKHENLEQSISDIELKKDDRYVGNKSKQEKKKLNRQRAFKKQKRRNKYEQWEMKGGFIRDYDDISLSSLEDYSPITSEQKSTITDGTTNHYSNRFVETEINNSLPNKKNKKNKIVEDMPKHENWYDKRVELRKVARQKLEQELFGEKGPNTARWYFKRMQKREQCRTKDNSTNRKLNDKRGMNYKTKQ
ncbi:uncharacterized protein LOC111004420 [Pieris rapae]|uniref:uncharacterized protein LOC111004420 n=1 Tax=Pieris rapae TaxID=64459 RepID=UPI001E28131B|nr:uncharacterized protein LOC111004420 [Pieris rapae]XP_022131141.2 uncharacterized protein LOC111004420 [Pieris rapae]